MSIREWIRFFGVLVGCVGLMLFPAGAISPRAATSIFPAALIISQNMFFNITIYLVVLGVVITILSYIKFPSLKK